MSFKETLNEDTKYSKERIKDYEDNLAKMISHYGVHSDCTQHARFLLDAVLMNFDNPVEYADAEMDILVKKRLLENWNITV